MGANCQSQCDASNMENLMSNIPILPFTKQILKEDPLSHQQKIKKLKYDTQTGEYIFLVSNSTNQFHLCKCIPEYIAPLSSAPFNSVRSIESSEKYSAVLNEKIFEVKQLPGIDHPNIAKVQEIYLYESMQQVVFKKIDGIPFAKLISQIEFYDIPDAKISQISIQLLSLLKYLNNFGIIHRNFCPEAFFINQKNQNLFLIDLGTCVFNTSSMDKLDFAINTSQSAPEMVEPVEWYDSKCDIWSVGVILFHIVYKDSPYHFSSKDQEHINSRVKEGRVKLAANKDPNIIKFLSRIFVADPQLREGTSELLGDEFISSNQKELRKQLIYSSYFKNIISFTGKHLLTNLLGKFFCLMDEEQMTNLFKCLDIDNDGQINQEELVLCFNIVLNDMVKSKEKAEGIFRILELSDDHELDQEEFSILAFRFEPKMVDALYEQINGVVTKCMTNDKIDLDDLIIKLDIKNKHMIDRAFALHSQHSNVINLLSLEEFLDLIISSSETKQKDKRWYNRFQNKVFKKDLNQLCTGNELFLQKDSILNTQEKEYDQFSQLYSQDDDYEDEFDY